MIKTILLPLLSHPDATPDWAIATADELAVRLDARLCAMTSVIHIPDVSNALARRLTSADAAIAWENHASRANADAVERRFSAITGSAEPARQSEVESSNFFVNAEPIAAHARLFDLSIVPVYDHPDTRSIAEALIFASGRPTLLLPQTNMPIWRHVMVAWNGSREAARALAAAIPLCRIADTVRIVTIAGDKDLSEDLSPDAVKQYLHHHGVVCDCDEIAANGKDAGEALLAHAAAAGASLLVMGAFGHSPMREFVFGGATATILGNVELPVLLSH